MSQPVEQDPMEELYELRTYIETGKYQEALLLLDEMEEMSRDDKINRISSFMGYCWSILSSRPSKKERRDHGMCPSAMRYDRS